MDDFGVDVFSYVRSPRTGMGKRQRSGMGGILWWRVRRSVARGSCVRWARARVDGVGESRVAFKPLVPLRGQRAGDVVGENEGEVGARRRGALVGSSPKCVLAGSVQRTGGLKATLRSSCRWRGGRAAWGGIRWWREGETGGVRLFCQRGQSENWSDPFLVPPAIPRASRPSRFLIGEPRIILC